MLLATDLHAGNVLPAAREPWLVIDPKPFTGDPAYDATQHAALIVGRPPGPRVRYGRGRVKLARRARRLRL